jgi:hypothetical protein
VPCVRSFRGAAESVRWVRAFVAVLIRPWLWWVALRQVARMARPEWWRRPPFLPLPPPAYLRFRLETAYGVAAAPAPADLVAYLEWCGSGATAASRHSRSGFRARR